LSSDLTACFASAEIQLLNFYRMAFVLFSLLAFLAAVVLMPLNLFVSGESGRSLTEAPRVY
jgi:hypothetical protein